MRLLLLHVPRQFTLRPFLCRLPVLSTVFFGQLFFEPTEGLFVDAKVPARSRLVLTQLDGQVVYSGAVDERKHFDITPFSPFKRRRLCSPFSPAL